MPERFAQAALAALIILQGIMLSSLYAGVAPHPPAVTPIAGMGPFIGAALALATATLIVGPANHAGRILGTFAALTALLSFGPQKYIDPQFAQIWPAVLLGQVSAAVLIANALRPARLQPA